VTSLRWPSVFLAGLFGLVLIAFAADRIRAQDAHDDIVVVPAAVSRDMLPELAPDLPAHALAAPASTPQEHAAVSVEVVRRTWWDDLWGVLLPLLAAGGTYLGIWLYVQGRRLLAANVVRDADEKRKSDERGQAGLGLLLCIVVGVPLMLSQVACASREVVTDRPLEVQMWEGPPCRIHVVEDGTPEPVVIVRNPRGSSLKCSVRGE